MTGNILTPLTVWGDFKTEFLPEAELVGEKKVGDVVLSRVYIDGQKTDKGQVKIYGVIARGVETGVAPGVIIFSDFPRPFDEKTAIDLAKRGYVALAIDLVGKTEETERFTRYPEDIEYANYHFIKDKIDYIENDVTGTCWYEWAVAGRYATEFLKNQACVNSVSALGIKEGAVVAWQVVANNDAFSSAVFVMNAGWKSYKQILKFGSGEEQQFSDDKLKYIAGIEPQSYAKHVKCPCLMLSSTNSIYYDADRAYDTVARINENAYRAVNYSVGNAENVGHKAIEHISAFIGAFTDRVDVEKIKLPEEPDIKCEIKDGEIKAYAQVDKTELKEVCVYVSEGVVDPTYRTWVKLNDGKPDGDGKYEFSFRPYGKSQIACLFVKATYKNGFSLCSNIISKRFSEKEVALGHKDKIIYSGRYLGAESIFTAIPPNDAVYGWRETDKTCVTVKKGPMSIDGVTAKGGLITFKMNTEKFTPDDYAILMLDLFVKEPAEFTVKLVKDCYGQRVEYVCTIRVKGGKIWNNIRLEMSRFKTVEGRILKTYQGIDAIEFYADSEFLINNALWI
jgi:dienelactone hydrolase